MSRAAPGLSGSASSPPGPALQCGRVLGRVSRKESKGRLFWLTVVVPGWTGARPGQFALLQAEPSRCFLARALSVADEERTGQVSFLIDPVGDGTRELCALSVGDSVWVLGPLGNGFDLDEILADDLPRGMSESSPSQSRRLLVVAGGVGVAPFPLLLSRLADRQTGWTVPLETIVLAGFRDASQAQAREPLETAVTRYVESGFSCRFALVTEDGSSGPPRKVTDLLAHELRPGDRVVVCGPTAMSTAVWRTCSRLANVRTWFSLEANMACGVGSCHGCAIALINGSLARVCREGPVFPGEAIFSPPLVPGERDGGPA